MMNLTENELEIIYVLLLKEAEDTRVEMHHSKNHEYKMYLADREKYVNELTCKIEKSLPVKTC